MKKHYIILGLFCLLAIVACSDNDPVVEVNNGNQTEEELPPLPTEVITVAVQCGLVTSRTKC